MKWDKLHEQIPCRSVSKFVQHIPYKHAERCQNRAGISLVLTHYGMFIVASEPRSTHQHWPCLATQHRNDEWQSFHRRSIGRRYFCFPSHPSLKNHHLKIYYDDVIKWKHFPRYWPFVRGIHRWPMNSPDKGQWRGALMFSLICSWINGWGNDGEVGGMRRHGAHYDDTALFFNIFVVGYLDTCDVRQMQTTPNKENRKSQYKVTFCSRCSQLSTIYGLHYIGKNVKESLRLSKRARS